jgi:hypothetical protein
MKRVRVSSKIAGMQLGEYRDPPFVWEQAGRIVSRTRQTLTEVVCNHTDTL